MKGLTISLHYHIEKSQFNFATTSGLGNFFLEQLSAQMPSKIEQKGTLIVIRNSLFRVKVDRLRNMLRAFNALTINLEEGDDKIKITANGTLYRGLFIAAMHGTISTLILLYAAPHIIWLALFVFVLSMLGQILSTHYLFPKFFSALCSAYLKTVSNEDS